MTLVRIYIVSGPAADDTFLFESSHTRSLKDGIKLDAAYEIIRRHPASVDAGTLFTWELSVVG